MRTFVRHERVITPTRRYFVYQPSFYDPYWFIAGSEIEKMVMAELVRRGIYFEYRPQSNDLGGFVDPTWEADFLLPQHKIWMEIQGAYYHTLPGQIRTDGLRHASIQMAGWKPVFLWEWDIRARLVDLLDEYPELRHSTPRLKWGRTNMGLPFFVGSLRDQLIGHRVAMSRRAAPAQFKRTVRVGRLPK